MLLRLSELPRRLSCKLRHLALMKCDHLIHDVWEAILNREMTGVEAMELRPREIPQVRLASLPGEEEIVLIPEDDRFRLLLPEECLPLGIELHIGPVIVEEVELDLPSVRTT